MPTVTFLPLGAVVMPNEGESLFAAARRCGVPIATACVGRASCGLCRVKIEAGERHLSPLNADEKRHLGNTYFITKLRLSCQARFVEDGHVVVRVPDGRRR